MIFKILKEYIRRITRDYKIYAISILGMSIAIIASFHIYHFVYKELSTDSFHTKSKNIYRIVSKRGHSNSRGVQTFPSLGNLLKERLPEVDNFTRIIPNGELNIYIDENKLSEPFLYADPSFFEMFSFSLKQGSVDEFRDTPNGVVLSEKKAKQFFPDENPIGKIILYESVGRNPKKKELIVVGVFNDVPENSTIQMDIIRNIQEHSIIKHTNKKESRWSIGFTHLYVLAPNIRENKSFTDKITDVLMAEFKVVKGSGDLDKNNFQYDAQRLDTIYFDSADIANQKRKGSMQFVKILILVGLLSLFLATCNYIIMNLGLNMNRAKEFKTRRCLGASKISILSLLLIESVLNAFICFVLSIVSYPIIGDFVSNLIGFEYQLSLNTDLKLLAIYFIIIISIGLITGFLEFILSYKSIFISKSNEIKSWFSKKLMIVFQLILFIGLLLIILFVRKQIDYIATKDVGFNKNIAHISPFGFNEVLKNELEAKSFVHAISVGEALFRPIHNLQKMLNEKTSNEIETIIIKGDANYLKAHEMTLLYGTNLNPSNKASFSTGFTMGKPITINKEIVEVLVNEEFVRKANLKNPLGTIFKSPSKGKVEIVGVFKNVHNTALYNAMQPIVLGHGFNSMPIMSFQMSYDENHKEELKSFLKTHYQNKGMTYYDRIEENLLSKYDYKEVYKKELILKRLLEAFTLIVLFISILGMIAISLFITESKTKEIGIRKVNGANINEIMLMLNKDFVKWVGIAFVIACPVAYYAMSKWLEHFAYKTSLSWWVFALAGLFTLIISLLTVSWQSYRAATRNPVEALRDE